MSEKLQFTFYLGLNDKDTLKQTMTEGVAKKTARNILLHHAGGGTIYAAEGFYTHDDGRITLEKTLRIEVADIQDEVARRIVEELKTTFNQESIGMRREVAVTDWV